MKKTYQITDDKFIKAKRLIQKNGGRIYTDNSFEIKGVKGNFKKDADSLTVVIKDKPWIVGWDYIEEKIDEFFEL